MPAYSSIKSSIVELIKNLTFYFLMIWKSFLNSYFIIENMQRNNRKYVTNNVDTYIKNFFKILSYFC